MYDLTLSADKFWVNNQQITATPPLYAEHYYVETERAKTAYMLAEMQMRDILKEFSYQLDKVDQEYEQAVKLWNEEGASRIRRLGEIDMQILNLGSRPAFFNTVEFDEKLEKLRVAKRQMTFGEPAPRKPEPRRSTLEGLRQEFQSKYLLFSNISDTRVEMRGYEVILMARLINGEYFTNLRKQFDLFTFGGSNARP